MDKFNCFSDGTRFVIFAMLSPAELKRPSKDPALTGSIPEEDDDDDERATVPQLGIFMTILHFLDYKNKIKIS